MQSIKLEFISFRWVEGPSAVQLRLEQTSLFLLDSEVYFRTFTSNLKVQFDQNMTPIPHL